MNFIPAGLMVLCTSVLSSALAVTDQGQMFGILMPPGAMVYAVDQGDGSYQLFAVRSPDDVEWPEVADGESWAEYLARVNALHGMPSATWTATLIKADRNLNLPVASLLAETPVESTHLVGYGDLSGPAGDMLVAAWLDETTLRSSVVDVPFEERTLTSFWAVGYPLDDDDALDIVKQHTVPFVDWRGSQGRCNFEIEGMDPLGDTIYVSGVNPTTCPVVVAQRAAVADGDTAMGLGLIGGKGNKLRAAAPRERVLLTNPAGIACLAAYNGASGACDTGFAGGSYTCTANLTGGLVAGASLACLSLVPFLGPAGWVGCMGASMMGGSYIAHQCRENASDAYSICNNGARGGYLACCAQAGTQCLGAR